MQLGRLMLLWLAIVVVTAPAAAQDPAPAPPPPPAATPAPAATQVAASPDAQACFPACREGFTCHQKRCISLCNPPCPDGLECFEGRRCEPPLPGGRAGKVYEPPAPPVKAFAERAHTLLGFHLGLPGDAEQDERDEPLGTTLGFNVRGDTPIANYVLLGPMLQLGAWSPDISPEPSNNYYVDLDLVLRVRAPITTSRFNYQLWLGMPIGVTIDVLGSEVPDVSGLGLGWNIGVLFGGAVHFTPKLGLFAEGGWLQHELSHSAEVGQDLDFELRQWCLNLGIVVKN
jgi:hypothetical protein